MNAEMGRDSEIGVQLTSAGFRTTPQIIGHISDFEIEEIKRAIEEQIDIFNA
jgi:hypothetical protein